MALKWPDKDPQEILDYPVSFADWLMPGRALQNQQITAIEADNNESPVAIQVPTVVGGVLLAASTAASPEILDTMVVWLEGGTTGVTYTFTLEADDDEATPIDRHVVRRVKIKVKEK